MKNQEIGWAGMGWEGVLERTLTWQDPWKIKVQNKKTAVRAVHDLLPD